MQKIISLYQRNYGGDRLVRDEVVPGAEWVLDGEGVATRKFDGTCCRIEGGALWKRYDLPLTKEWKVKKKQGFDGPFTVDMYVHPPLRWASAQAGPDPNSGHWPGWLPVSETAPEDQYHRAAWNRLPSATPADGTYELIGPKVQGGAEEHRHDADGEYHLVRHGASLLEHAPRNFLALHDYFTHVDIEGIVWHHPDGRMVKIKGKDFGVPRPWLPHCSAMTALPNTLGFQPAPCGDTGSMTDGSSRRLMT